VKTTIKFVISAGLLLVLLIPWSSLAQTQQLPISSFLNAQLPTQQQFWSDPVSGGLVGFDAFGKRNEALGLNLDTSISGGVTIRDLGNGTERVTVDIHTHDAVCFGFVNGIPAFGRSPAEIAGGAAPSLGEAHIQIGFTQPVGAPLQTWNVIAFGGPPIVLETVKTSIICQGGELRSGSGFPDGTPGFAQTTQIGLFSTGVPTGCPPEKNADCFPAEKIQFKPNGS
jgi:hypothetical protein